MGQGLGGSRLGQGNRTAPEQEWQGETGGGLGAAVTTGEAEKREETKKDKGISE